MWASKSLYSHVGIIEVADKKTYVIEAISKVSRTPLEDWIQRGRFDRYAVYRYDGLTEKNQVALVENAKKHLGQGYDIFFTSQNKEIYCSELVSLAFQKTGISVGKFEKVKDLDVDNFIVRSLVEKRWRKHPLCHSGIEKFEDCWAKILDDELVSPASLAADPRLKQIFSNYLW